MRIMHRFVIISVLIVSLLTSVSAQDNNLPVYGDIVDLKGLQKVYLISDSADARELILKELKKYSALNVVSSPDEAEFFLEYKVLRHDDETSITTSEMTAYTLGNKSRRVAWSKTEDDEGITRPNEVNLARNFIKALKRARAEK